ncbi:hypothetical protein HWD99_12865 [Microbacterium sp. C5A9]|uniref:hypothetical protein n=1 Tax=Microbacterium sp. C5A9 TaxID=2736663 RepID=UPI001F51B08B|nr:hypothetical protein [Microbacterium sp. C5A9]MCI1019520.1 hypothetical protein [Microbacterium sp. C5A9]
MTELSLHETRARSSISRLLIVTPLLVGVILLAAAVGWTLVSGDLGFFGFLLMLIGGWAVAFAFVNATLEMRPPALGAIVHVGVAAALTALMYWAIEHGGEPLAALPEAARATVVVLQIAAAPALGWIWLGLISRITDLFSRHDSSRRPAPVAPTWERDASGDGSVVEFAAVAVRMREITAWIVAMVLVGGLGGVAVLIALDDVFVQAGPKIAVIVVGLVIALPAYLLFLAVVRRRTVACRVAFGNDELRIRVASAVHVIPFRQIERLVWRTASDYARVEVRGAQADLSLVVGLAKARAGRTSELPALPRRVFRRFELAGLDVERGRRDDIVTFCRRR